MAINITEWYGRLGNNLIQISSALKICEINSTNLILHNDLGVFDNNFIKVCDVDSGYEEYGNFWLKHINDNERRNICQKYITDKIKFKDSKNIDIVIHIRGGDIFLKSPSYYVQAPIRYIDKVLGSELFDNIHVVCEDFLNPMVNYILNNYKNVKIITDFNEGIEYILSAKIIVTTGFSTFPRMLSMCSKNVKKIYIPFFEKSIKDYVNICKDWNIEPDPEKLKNDYFFSGGLFCEFSDVEIIGVNIENYMKYGEWDWSDPVKKEMFFNKI